MTGDADAGGVECELEPIAGAEAETGSDEELD